MLLLRNLLYIFFLFMFFECKKNDVNPMVIGNWKNIEFNYNLLPNIINGNMDSPPFQFTVGSLEFVTFESNCNLIDSKITFRNKNISNFKTEGNRIFIIGKSLKGKKFELEYYFEVKDEKLIINMDKKLFTKNSSRLLKEKLFLTNEGEVIDGSFSNSNTNFTIYFKFEK